MKNRFPLVHRNYGIRGGVCCLNGTGVFVEFIAGRFSAGESIADLACDYHVSADIIEEGIRLVVAGAFCARGLPVRIERRMESFVPLDDHPKKPRRSGR